MSLHYSALRKQILSRQLTGQVGFSKLLGMQTCPRGVAFGTGGLIGHCPGFWVGWYHQCQLSGRNTPTRTLRIEEPENLVFSSSSWKPRTVFIHPHQESSYLFSLPENYFFRKQPAFKKTEDKTPFLSFTLTCVFT